MLFFLGFYFKKILVCLVWRCCDAGLLVVSRHRLGGHCVSRSLAAEVISMGRASGIQGMTNCRHLWAPLEPSRGL